MDSSKNDHGFYGSGWAFPPLFEAQNHQLETTNRVANINESIDIILATNQGERSMLPFFGSGLQQFMFKKMDSTMQGEIAEAVKSTLLDYEPRIEVNEVIVTFPDGVEGMVTITIDYTIASTNTRHNHVFPFNLIEGTNLS